MKNSKLYSLILIFAVALLSIQCTTDPIEGPPGQNGVDGIDGVDGVDGVNGTAECAECHNVANSEEVHSSYLFSGHYNEDMTHERPIPYPDGPDTFVPLSRYANRSSCVVCHTSDGYIDLAETGSFINTRDEPAYPGTQTITCTTCHGKHTSFDFVSDGFDYALRVFDPITLVADESYTIDYGINEKSSHTCAQCHQPRGKFEGNIQEDGSVRVTSRFGPHHGPQSTMLEGIQGAEIAGSLAYDPPKSARHRSGLGDISSSCTKCHMGEDAGPELTGLHTNKPTETSCVACHTNGIPGEVTGLADHMATLTDLLIEAGLLALNADDELEPVSGNYDVTRASALWNYILILEDSSNGVHNPNYAKALIQNSIEALNGN